LRNRSLVLLSGEPTSIPRAEAKALFLAYDSGSRFESPEQRVLLAQSTADPFVVGARIAFSKRVGPFISTPSEVAETVRGKPVRVRSFSLPTGSSPVDPEEVLRGLDVRVDLENPAFELTVVEGKRRYLALTSPTAMRQGWSLRRPRRRPFFHPAAIFPKLSRALVNLSRCKEGELFLDPFAGTGSLALEASEIGAKVVAFDRAGKMTRGSLANMKKFGQEWLGVVMCDSFSPPVTRVDAIATDVPYGRASSTGGKGADRVVRDALSAAQALLRSGSMLVIMHPKNLPAEPGSEWSFEEEHELYVHKRLTRAITVLRRK
jgi:putative methyltransferase (TIGR01177 family)